MAALFYLTYHIKTKILRKFFIYVLISIFPLFLSLKIRKKAIKNMNETDLIIKATTLLAKDLIVDGNIRKTLLKFQSNLQQTVAEEENDERKSTDDDIELLLMRKFLTKKRNFAGSDNTKVAKKSKLSVHNKLNPSSRKSYSKMNSTSTASEIVLQNTMKSKSKPRIKSNVQPEPKRLPDNNYQYFIFLQQCDDLTFQNQFKFTKKTFEVKMVFAN